MLTALSALLAASLVLCPEPQTPMFNRLFSLFSSSGSDSSDDEDGGGAGHGGNRTRLLQIEEDAAPVAYGIH